MNKIYFICVIMLGTMLYSCQTVNQISIDYLVPASVNFPTQIKRVGVINNVSEVPGRIKEDAMIDSIFLSKTNGNLEKYVLNGDAVVATEALAKYIAAENYFDEVIICDSALQVSGTPKQDNMTMEAVNGLIRDLDVDMLISLEQLRINVQRQAFQISGMGYFGTTSAKIYPNISLYVPNRQKPMIMINGNDSIFWEGLEPTQAFARSKVAPDQLLIAEASEFAGSIPIKHMTPHWETAARFLYTSGSPEMRDAAFFTQNNKWDRALPLWEKVYETREGRKKARAASNISLYYEINDKLEEAVEWGEKALELAKTADKIKDEVPVTTINDANDYMRISYNQMELLKRKNNFSTLKIQMDRFNDDF